MEKQEFATLFSEGLDGQFSGCPPKETLYRFGIHYYAFREAAVRGDSGAILRENAELMTQAAKIADARIKSMPSSETAEKVVNALMGEAERIFSRSQAAGTSSRAGFTSNR